jgi:hypothetical protein
MPASSSEYMSIMLALILFDQPISNTFAGAFPPSPGLGASGTGMISRNALLESSGPDNICASSIAWAFSSRSLNAESISPAIDYVFFFKLNHDLQIFQSFENVSHCLTIFESLERSDWYSVNLDRSFQTSGFDKSESNSSMRTDFLETSKIPLMFQLSLKAHQYAFDSR